MQAGKLRHRVTIEVPGAGQNDFGEPVDAWTPYAVVSGNREHLVGQEAFAAQQVHATVTTRFVLRFLEGVTAKMRLLCDGVTYNAVSVADPDGRRRTLTVIASREG